MFSLGGRGEGLKLALFWVTIEHVQTPIPLSNIEIKERILTRIKI
jgi:hypothetical protein